MALQVWLPLNGNIKNQGLSNITVTNNGATVNDNGKIDKCYSFATNQYIQLTNVPASSLSNCSVCFWIKIAANEGQWLLLSGQGVQYYLLAYRDASFQNGNFYSSANVGTSYKIYIDGVEGTAPIHDGNWHHYCASGINLSSWTQFYINRYQTTTDGYNFTGQVNDFRIYDHALSAKEVKDISKGLILHYPLEGNVDNFVTDCSGYNNNGTIVGTLTSVDNSPRYVTATYMNNTNTSNHVEVNKIFCADNIRSISFWVKCSKSKNQVLIADPGVMVIGLLNNLIYVNPTSSTPFSTTNFITNEWNHIVAIRNGTSYSLYINGQPEVQSGRNNYYIHNGTNLWLFNRNSNNNYAADASMSDVRIYSTILSAEDILELYNTSAYICDSNVMKGYKFSEVGLIPNGYKQIEYLESSGTQRIDTNIVGGKNTAIEIKFYVSSIGSSYEGIFGSRVASNNTNSISLFTQNTSNVNQRFGSQVLATQIKINTLYTIYLDKTKITINDTTTNWNQTADFTTPGTLTLFGIDSFTKSKCKIYYTKIWEDEELVLDLIPVRADNIGYMYDTVSGQVFGNSGSGSFVLGQDAEDVYQDVNIYKNGLIECNEFTENTGSTTFGDSYVLSEEFIEI